MRHEFRRVFEIGRPAGSSSRGPFARRRETLPIDIAFLETAHLERAILDSAVERARREGVSAWRALLADGRISDTLYFLALARHLNVPFIDRWTAIAPTSEPEKALRSGRVRLAQGGQADWLIAPSDADITLLLRARAARLALPRIAIATPHYFCGLLRQACRARFAHEASLALPERAPRLSARGAADRNIAFVLCLGLIAAGLAVSVAPRSMADLFGVLFFAATSFRLLVCAAGLFGAANKGTPPPDCDLPFYTILVPLYEERAMAGDLVASLKALDYPRAKLEVLFLTEQDDGRTRLALQACDRPHGFRVITLPDGAPRTKPRALNLGLMLARGTLVTVFDAEDRPNPDQLRKAAAAFAIAPARVGCFQARLAISNCANGLLPSLFAIEYAALFDLFNIGLSECRLPLPLGGTSNHFRVEDLRAVGAWDAWNVTEDADLGLRLARFGFETRSLDSATWETALADPTAWLKQRRRWTKGWMQTFLVLVRDRRAAFELGPWRSIVVALMLSNLVIGPLLLPFVLAIMAYHVGVQGWPNPHGIREGIEATLAVSVAMLGVGATLWCGVLGMRRRGLHRSWSDLPWFLPYQLLISLAAWVALWDLIRRPYHWHKTEHRHVDGPVASDVGLTPAVASP